MKRDLVSIKSKEISGTGNALWGVIRVDQDDSEDSSLSLWKANDEEHLFEQVKVDYCGDAEDGFMAEETFSEEWGFSLLPQYIGEIK